MRRNALSTTNRWTLGWLAGQLLLLSLLAALILPAAALASPLFQVAQIASPGSGATVQGAVTITGTAVHPEFQRYELYFTIEPGENWVFIGDAHFEQVNNGPLGVWDTRSLPDGNYSLRLRVVRQDGNYDETYARNIVVANSTPPTPTPTEFVAPTLPPIVDSVVTPTPEATATPAVVQQPEIATPTPRPSPTVTPEAVVGPTDGEDGGETPSITDSIGGGALGDALATGVAYAATAFVAAGAFFGLKRLLTWLWYLIAP